MKNPEIENHNDIVGSNLKKAVEDATLHYSIGVIHHVEYLKKIQTASDIAINQINKNIMNTIYNDVKGSVIFSSDNDAEFVHFVRKIAVENDDEEISITCIGEAKDYIGEYCDNLRLTDMKVYHITKNKFLQWYFESGQDSEIQHLKEELAEKVLEMLFKNNTATITAEDIFENVNIESIKIGYLVEFEDVEDAEGELSDVAEGEFDVMLID